MVVQNNNSHWVILGLVILCIAVTFGIMLGGLPVGASQEVRDEQARSEIRATELARSPMETAQAILSGQTAMAAQLTAMPPAQTATAIALSENQRAMELAATQTAIAHAENAHNLAFAATATSIANRTNEEESTRTTGITLAIIITSALSFGVVGYTIARLIHARTQNIAAHAQLLNEQRKLAQVRASLPKGPRSIVQPPIPASLMKERGNGHKPTTAG